MKHHCITTQDLFAFTLAAPHVESWVGEDEFPELQSIATAIDAGASQAHLYGILLPHRRKWAILTHNACARAMVRRFLGNSDNEALAMCVRCDRLFIRHDRARVCHSCRKDTKS